MHKICLDIGHTPKSPGAINSRYGITEYTQNAKLAAIIAKYAHETQKLNPIIVYRETYANLHEQINNTCADICISIHANGYSNGNVSGTETLFFNKSTRSERLATIVQKKMVSVLGLDDRGVKGVSTDDRGGSLLASTKMQHVLIEPYFITCDSDLVTANKNINKLAKNIVSAIREYLDV